MTHPRLYSASIAASATGQAPGHRGATPLVVPPSAAKAASASHRYDRRPENGNDAPTLAIRFQQLVRTWKKAVAFCSSTTEQATHPAYQQIIGMGREAIPLIVAELKREPDHWFWALKAITGEDPVPVSGRGKLDKMTAAWLRWAEDRGY